MLRSYWSEKWIWVWPAWSLTSINPLAKIFILIRIVVCTSQIFIFFVFSVGSLFYFAIINNESYQENKYKYWSSNHELHWTKKWYCFWFRLSILFSYFINRVDWSDTDLIVILIRIFIWRLIKNHVVIVHKYASKYPYVIVSKFQILFLSKKWHETAIWP